jgi:hypothetical protein
MAFRPSGAPSPTREMEEFIAPSRKAEVAAWWRSRILNGAVFTMIVGIILGLIGWINQSTIAKKWRWYRDERPFAKEAIWPYVRAATAERALKPGETFREGRGEYEDSCPEMVVNPGWIIHGIAGARDGRRSVRRFPR